MDCVLGTIVLLLLVAYVAYETGDRQLKIPAGKKRREVISGREN